MILPKDYPVRKRGCCVPAAYIMLKNLGRGDAVSGYVHTPERPTYVFQHTWVEVDGDIIDPTIRQFRWWRKGADVKREPVKRFQRDEFLSQFENVAYREASEQSDHYRKFEKWYPATRTPEPEATEKP